jgi:hypothetical protein
MFHVTGTECSIISNTGLLLVEREESPETYESLVVLQVK